MSGVSQNAPPQPITQQTQALIPGPRQRANNTTSSETNATATSSNPTPKPTNPQKLTLEELHKELKEKRKNTSNRFLQAIISIPEQKASDLTSIIIPFNIWQQTFIDETIEKRHKSSKIFEKTSQGQLNNILSTLEKEVPGIKVWVNFPTYTRITVLILFILTIIAYSAAAWMSSSMFLADFALIGLFLLIVLSITLVNLVIEWWEDGLFIRERSIADWLIRTANKNRKYGVRFTVGALGAYLKVTLAPFIQRDVPVEDKTQDVFTPQVVASPRRSLRGAGLRPLSEVTERREVTEGDFGATTRTRGSTSRVRLNPRRVVGGEGGVSGGPN